ncbi:MULTISPECIES: HEAT repeat domain-containing protein [unclassified Solwaraspora]|uniref:HEAT repeat domain-containing protein n=1 Tax=unclassified Solwaraspora TaxID=2627926 RepID=UPI00248BEE8E|nr:MULTISPECIES: HEAT repeat domain-containing protein [unclassified Solwaraspora]WBB96723.1 HEAT repeat domain-containing protein [Solwaraspora sp. WMMA2059]WBC19373.1 HEAT repeat domain-containing protein [Solwaraspora sp. WMMA2080]WJK33184.1 HEAT repeat domain-containing protein [Solwaraspora sp. WMMA2065]
MIAIGDESYWLTESPDIAAVRREVDRQAAMTLAELEHEQSMWVAAAVDGEERRARESTVRYRDVEADRCAARWDLEAYDAVRSGVAVYVAALRSPEPAVRLHAAHLLAWFPEERDLIVPALTRVIAGDSDPVVAATACVAAGLCGATQADTGLVEALSRRRAGPNRAERWSAVLGVARLTARPPRALVEELYACLLDATEPVPDWPFLAGGMSGLAALTLARLDSDSATDRVEILARRLADTVPGTDRFTLVGALLDAAFPEHDATGRGRDAGATGPGRIVDAQQAAVRALVDSVVWEDGPMVAMLLGRYGLPSAPASLRGWLAGGR